MEIQNDALCKNCQCAWTKAYAITSDLTDLKLTYEEQHDFPKPELLAGRAAAGCQLCSILRLAIQDDAFKWFKRQWDELESYCMTIVHLEIFLDRQLAQISDTKPYAKGRCVAFVEFPRDFMESLGLSNLMEVCDFTVLLNHGRRSTELTL
jgi:hypothetical protein